MARQGSNPAKVANTLPPYGTVRLIVPVPVSVGSGSGSDQVAVLQAMMDSIRTTTDDRVQVTVIDNCSAPEVAEKLAVYADAGRIDRLVSNRRMRNVGAAVDSELRASYEPVMVVASAGVVFRPGWVDAVLAAFGAFPECGLFSLRSSCEQPPYVSTSILAASLGAGSRVGRVASVDTDEGKGPRSGADGPDVPLSRRLAVVRRGTAVNLGFDPLVFAVRRELTRTLSSAGSIGLDQGMLEARVDAAGWWCTSAPRPLVHPLGTKIDDETVERVRRFVRTSFTDEPGELRPARRARFCRWVPLSVRRVMLAMAKSACAQPSLARWILPDLEVVQEPRSALRVVSE